MAVKKIDFKDLLVDGINMWLNRWCLLTAGDMEESNSMTIGWGALGGMWSRPFIQVVVRPQRYTFGFMEKYPDFTVSVLPETYRNSMTVMGSRSGRDTDKVKEAGLTTVKSNTVASPSYKEAELVFECRKNYWQDMDPSHFLDKAIFEKYPAEDYHRIYYGEILAVYGEDIYE